MELKLTNENYCGTITTVKRLMPLDKCDNIQGTIIFGNRVIVSNDVKIGDIGVFFPVECSLSNEFLSSNNLYRDSELNSDKSIKGYFDSNRRIRCQKLRGHDSEGLFIPLSFFSYIGIDTDILKTMEDGTFNEINGIEIVTKHINKKSVQQGTSGKERNNPKHKTIQIVEDQFKFHINTPHLGSNMYKLNPDDIIQITRKIHGTSCITSNLLVYRKLSLRERIYIAIGRVFKVYNDYFEYKNIYASRTVIKNDNLDNSYYKVDVWGKANDIVKECAIKGMTLYYEIAGYLPDSETYIQKPFDYGCEKGCFKIYVYRITHTDNNGHTIEYTPKMVSDFCEKFGINTVPELYYGSVRELLLKYGLRDTLDDWRDQLLEKLKDEYLEKDCTISKNKVPAEGVVIRKEGLKLEVFKFKSTKFKLFESKSIDNGDKDIEGES